MIREKITLVFKAFAQGIRKHCSRFPSRSRPS